MTRNPMEGTIVPWYSALRSTLWLVGEAKLIILELPNGFRLPSIM